MLLVVHILGLQVMCLSFGREHADRRIQDGSPGTCKVANVGCKYVRCVVGAVVYVVIFGTQTDIPL